MKEPPKVGEFGKVFLPGESPWAECVAVLKDGRWVGRISNTLVAESPELKAQIAKQFGTDRVLPSLHSYKKDDCVIFKLQIEPDYEIWVPDEQVGGTA